MNKKLILIILPGLILNSTVQTGWFEQTNTRFMNNLRQYQRQLTVSAAITGAAVAAYLYWKKQQAPTQTSSITPQMTSSETATPSTSDQIQVIAKNNSVELTKEPSYQSGFFLYKLKNIETQNIITSTVTEKNLTSIKAFAEYTYPEFKRQMKSFLDTANSSILITYNGIESFISHIPADKLENALKEGKPSLSSIGREKIKGLNQHIINLLTMAPLYTQHYAHEIPYEKLQLYHDVIQKLLLKK